MISVIMPVYNTEKYLKKAVESVLNQTYTDFELLIIDDGSTDGSAEICDNFAAMDSRIKVLHQSNNGQSAARNAALKFAEGEYVYFMDSDDFIDESTFKTLLNQINESDSDMSMGNYLYVDEEGKGIDELNNLSGISAGTLTNMQYLNKLLSSASPHYARICNKLFKITLFHDITFPEGKIYEDEAIMHKLIYNCRSISITSYVLYFYVKHPLSTTTSKFTVKKFDRDDAYYSRVLFFMEKGLTDLAVDTSFYGLTQGHLSLKEAGKAGFNDRKILKDLKNKYLFEYNLCKKTHFKNNTKFKTVAKIMASDPYLLVKLYSLKK